MWVGIIQPIQSPHRTKREKLNSFPLSLCLCLTAWAETLVFACPWTGTYTIGAPCSQAFRLRLKFTLLAFLSLQFADGRPWEPLRLHNHMSEFFTINLIQHTHVCSLARWRKESETGGKTCVIGIMIHSRDQGKIRRLLNKAEKLFWVYRESSWIPK